MSFTRASLQDSVPAGRGLTPIAPSALCTSLELSYTMEASDIRVYREALGNSRIVMRKDGG